MHFAEENSLVVLLAPCDCRSIWCS